jgi:hypothetical protein
MTKKGKKNGPIQNSTTTIKTIISSKNHNQYLLLVKFQNKNGAFYQKSK